MTEVQTAIAVARRAQFVLLLDLSRALRDEDHTGALLTLVEMLANAWMIGAADRSPQDAAGGPDA